MFVGNIDSWTWERAYPKVIQESIAYLEKQNFTAMEDGRYELNGDKVFFNLQRYQTRSAEMCRPESHTKYIDIQYLVEGEEYLGWCPFSPDLKVAVPYDAEKDVTFYEKLVPESSIFLSPGTFVVLYPEDVHSPCISVDEMAEPVLKVVVKVSLDLL